MTTPQASTRDADEDRRPRRAGRLAPLRDFLIKVLGGGGARQYRDGPAAPVHGNPHGRDRRTVDPRLAAKEWQTIFDAMKEGMALLDPQHTVIRCNKALSTLLGKPVDEIIGQDCCRLLHGKVGSTRECPVLKASGTLQRETWTAALNGRWFDIAADPVLDGAGRLTGFTHVMTDITERKQAEEALRESEARLKRVLEVETVGVMFWDLITGSLVDANDTFLRMMGYDRRDMDERRITWQTLTPPEFIEVSLAEITRLRRTGRVGPYEKEYIRKDGGRQWFVFAGSALGGDMCVEFCVDISVRKKTEEALRESEKELRMAHARLRRFVDANVIGVVVAGAGGEVYDANDYYLDLIGFTREEFERGEVDWRALTPPEWLQADEKAIAELRERGVCAPYEKEYVRRDGTRVAVLLADSILPGPEGLIAAFALDITERKRAEVALSASEMKHRLLFATSRDAIMTLAPPAWHFTSGNPATLVMFGARDEADFTSRAPWEYSPELQPDGDASDVKARKMIEKAMAEGSHFFPWTYRRLDGGEFPATVLLTRFELAGQVLLQATVRDVRHEQELEAQLRQSQRLESIGLLAGGVAHDFNNLLTVILGYAELTLSKLKDSDRIHKDILQIEKAGKRAAALTRQLLAFSRKQVLEPQVLDLNRVIADVEKMLRRLLGEDIEIDVHLSPALGRVMADPGQIEQVIMNLCVNSRDAMPHGGKLIIGTSNAELDQFYASRHVGVVPGSYVMLSISDTGSGMTAAIREHIFEPFFTTKGKSKGTGLGLSTVYGIVKQSGGNIWVYSEPGHGTAFKIYLPRVEAPEGVIRARSDAAPHTGTETVMIVEDEDSVRGMAERILRGAGYAVLSAASGEEALVLWEKSGHIHLLLTDVVMPQMSGRELADRLAMTKPGLKVLYMSGYADDAIVHHGVLDPGTVFIGKPFSAADLTRKVRETLDRR